LQRIATFVAEISKSEEDNATQRNAKSGEDSATYNNF